MLTIHCHLLQPTWSGYITPFYTLAALTWLWPNLLGQNLFSSKEWPQIISWVTPLHTCGEDQQEHSLPNKKLSRKTKSSALSWLSCPKENLLVIWLGRTWRKGRDCLILILPTLKSPLYERLCWLGLCLQGFSGRESHGKYGTGRQHPLSDYHPHTLRDNCETLLWKSYQRVVGEEGPARDVCVCVCVCRRDHQQQSSSWRGKKKTTQKNPKTNKPPENQQNQIRPKTRKLHE